MASIFLSLVPGLEDSSTWNSSGIFLSLFVVWPHSLFNMGFRDKVDISMAAQIPKAICLKRENQTRFLNGLSLEGNSSISVTFTGRGTYITPPREEG